MVKKRPSHVPKGYEIGMDEQGLTARERTVRDLIVNAHTMSEIGSQLGITRQRTSQIVAILVQKNVIEKSGGKFRLVDPPQEENDG